MVLGAGRGNRFEHEQHALREVAVGVLFEPDVVHEVFHVDCGAEGALGAGLGAVALHHGGEVVEVDFGWGAGQVGVERQLGARHRLAE
jgi:hypothetical protein